MADSAKSTTDKPVVDVKDNHDRIALPSVAKDGSLDQLDPEFIGDPEFTKEAVREQFKQNAVSAVDDANRAAAEDDTEVSQDPSIEAAQKEHEKAAKKAESAADKLVDSNS